MAFTTMTHYYKKYKNRLRNSDFNSPWWLDLSLLVGMLLLFSYFSYQINQIEYLYLKEPIATPEAQILPKTPLLDETINSELTLRETGVASWYDYRLKTDAPGEYWSKTHDTCATRGWNRYGKAKVTNLANGKSVTCYINDDGPRDCEYRYKYKLDKPGECVERLIDLSSHAFSQIADLGSGLINVEVEIVDVYSSSSK